jgi:hypothetical protein
MKDDEVMFILESIAYISATIAAFVYIWETCYMNKVKYINKRYTKSDSDTNTDERTRLSSSGNSRNSLFDEF